MLLLPLQGEESFPWCSVGIFHRRQSSMSFSWVTALHKLLQNRSLSLVFSPSRPGCSSMGSHGITSPVSKPAPQWAPLPMDPLRGLFQQRLSKASQPPFRHPWAPVWGSLHGQQVDLCTQMDFHGLQEHILPHLHHGLHHRLQRDLSSGTQGPSCAAFFADLGL